MRRLIIRPGAIGDCILSFPAIEHLRDIADESEVWISRPCAPLLPATDSSTTRAIEDTALYRPIGGDGSTQLVKTLRTFDLIDSWYGAKLDEFRDWAVRERLPFRFHQALPDASGGTHAADFFLRQVNGPPESAVPRIVIPAPDDASGFVAIQPFSGSPRKNWPLHHFHELARAFDLEVKWTAGPEEPLDHAHRFDSLYDLACWLKTARLYVGNDSGITHLAAACGVPVVAIFRASDPGLWAPRGDGPIEILDGRSSEVSVDAALAACRRVLAAGRA